MNKYSNELVQKVNELYHNLISENYDVLYSEMFRQEAKIWKKNFLPYLSQKNSITILDIGTGTGFVPITIGNLLRKNCVFICTDVSQKILKTAEKNIDKHFDCKFKFVKIESSDIFKLPLKDRSIDVVTINSVLHHIQDTEGFIKEIDRVLKPYGLIFIGHEPNRYFYENKFLWYNYKFMEIFTNFQVPIKKIAEKTHTIKILRKFYYSLSSNKKKEFYYYKDICEKINKQLFKNKLITKPLTPEQIGKITDVKVNEGFYPDLIFPDYKLEYFETYNHLNEVVTKNYDNKFIKKYDEWLKKRFPKKGATFFIVLKNMEFNMSY